MTGWKSENWGPHKKKQTLVCSYMHCTLQRPGQMQTEDTDVMVLRLGFNRDIHCSIYQVCSKKPHRIQWLRETGQFIGRQHLRRLIGIHAFTGCDTVSAITGRGKLGALKLMKTDKTYQETFSQLGQSWEASKQLFNKIQMFTCHLDATTVSTDEVNELRYQLFCAKRGEVESSSHHAEIASTCMFFVPTTNHQSAAFRLSHLWQTWMSMHGRQVMTAIWSLSGCPLLQPQRQPWNCCHASAYVPANCQAARVLSMDWHAPTCASYIRAAIRRKKNSLQLN